MELRHRWLGTDVDYRAGLEAQESAVQKLLDSRDGSPAQAQLLSLEHTPVYTIGRTRDQSSLGHGTATLPHPVVEISRGGQATYHGPGQLTGYPILDLQLLGRDLHAYIRALEEALILASGDFGVTAQRRDGLTGVWVEDRKLASIGVGVRKWISMHGYAINVTRRSLSGFLSITPCGLQGVSMTCLESESGKKIDVRDFANACASHLEKTLVVLEGAQQQG